jgi:hypothetical protein
MARGHDPADAVSLAAIVMEGEPIEMGLQVLGAHGAAAGVSSS